MAWMAVGRVVAAFSLAVMLTYTAEGQASRSPQQRKGAAAPVDPMSRADVERVMASDAFDKAVAGMIDRRGLAFEPDEIWLEGLLRNPKAAEKPEAIRRLRAQVAACPDGDSTAREIPVLIDRLVKASLGRNEAAMAEVLHQDLWLKRAEIADYFSQANYKRHVVRNLVKPQGRCGRADLFLLTSAMQERFFWAGFGMFRKRLVIRDLVSNQQVVEEGMKGEKQRALAAALEIFRGLNDGSDRAGERLSTKALYDDLKRIGGYRRFLRGTAFSQANANLTASIPPDQGSLRVAVRAAFRVGQGVSQVDLDFDRIGEEWRVVRVRDPKGAVAAIDPLLNNYLLARYGLPAENAAVNPPRSQEPGFLPIDAVLKYADAALAAGDGQQLLAIAQEALTIQPDNGDALGYLAGGHYLQRRYADAERFALQAVQNGGRAWFLVYHRFFEARPLQLVKLAIGPGEVYYGGQTKYEAQAVPAERVTRFAIKRNLLEFNFRTTRDGRKMSNVEMDFFAIGSQAVQRPGCTAGPNCADIMVPADSAQALQCLVNVFQAAGVKKR